MAALRAFLAGLALTTAAPVEATTVADWRPLVAAASARFGVPVAWIERVMLAESGGRTTRAGRPVVSRAGAMGLMQIMPATWAELRVTYRLGNDPFDPHDNIVAGVAYLRRMYDRFGYPGLFAAYNAGPGRYAAYLAGARPLPGETRAYLVAVAGAHGAPSVGHARAAIAQPATLFAILTRAPPPVGATPHDQSAAPLFVALSTAHAADLVAGCASAGGCR